MKIERRQNHLVEYQFVKGGEIFRRRYDSSLPDAPIYLNLDQEVIDDDGVSFTCVNLETGKLVWFSADEDMEILDNAKITVWR